MMELLKKLLPIFNQRLAPARHSKPGGTLGLGDVYFHSALQGVLWRRSSLSEATLGGWQRFVKQGPLSCGAAQAT